MVSAKILVLVGVIVLVAGIGIGYAIKPAPQAAIPVSWRSTFLIQAADAPMFTALDKGWFADAGISLSIYRGFGSAATITSVSQGTDQFGIGGWGALQSAIAKGSNVIGVRNWYTKSITGFTFFESSNIKTPKDLEGKRIGLSSFDVTYIEWPAFAKANNIDASKVEIVSLTTDLYLSSLFTGKVDVIGAFEDSFEKFQINAAQQGQPKLAWMGFRDWGFENEVPYLLIVNKTFLEEHPDVVRNFNLTQNRGVQFAQANTDEALSILFKHNPDLNENAERAGVKVSIPIESPDGVVDPAKIQYTLDLYKELLNLQPTVTPDQIYTDKYLQ